MDLAAILKHLGVFKNPILIFGAFGQITTHGAAGLYLDKGEWWQQAGGLVMHLIGAVLLIAFGVFYLYALVKLPGSAQELKFEESTKEALKDHAEALPKRRKKVKTQTT